MIKAVYGKVDAWDVIFKQSGDGWTCTVPPDWSDGQYACSFVAQSDWGALGYWTGILYITDGNTLCPRLQSDIFTAWLLPEPETVLCGERVEAILTRRERA